MRRLDIIPLADRLDLIPVVARWHWDEWGDEDPTGSVETWTEGLRSRSNRDEIPISWVALADGVPAGSIALIHNDMSTHPELTPWLSGLFVLPELRGLGIATALVRHCEQTAARLGVKRVYLYTTTAIGLYAKTGWRPFTQDRYGSDVVTIMARDLTRTDGR